MTRFVRNGRVAVLLLVFAACRDATAPSSVAEARLLWESHNLTTYGFVGSQACFCALPNGPVQVDVVDGKVSSVTDLTTHAQISSAGWLTVEQLFDLAETVQSQPLEFDKDLGFPKKVERCCISNDSGSIYTVSSVFLIGMAI